MRVLVHYTMPDFLAPACNHEAWYVVVQCNTPGLLTPNMLAKIYHHENRMGVPSTQELVAEAP